MVENIKILRDLPGISRVIELCRTSRAFDYPQYSYTYGEIAAISDRLFCVSSWDTEWPPSGSPELSDDWEEVCDEIEGSEDLSITSANDDETKEEEELKYEEQFQVTTMPWPESEPFWRAIGWDISDGAGKELVCAHFFARQIIALEGGIIKGAVFHPKGDGTAAYDDDGNPISTEASWTDSLAREAAAFLEKRGRR